MTVLSSETRLIGSGTAVLPRVNLLPPEIAEKRAFRRVQLGLGAAVAASVGVIGLLVVSAGHSVSSAQDDLDAATARQAVLQKEVGKYRNVTAIYAAADAAQSQLSTAMGDEVRYSQLLNDLSLSVPSNVWLKNVNIVTGPTAGTAAPAAGTAAPVAAAGTAGTVPAAAANVGTFTVTGVGFDHDDVAVWLESIAGLKTYASPYFSDSTESLLGKRKVVNFTGNATITSSALSGRYTKPAGG